MGKARRCGPSQDRVGQGSAGFAAGHQTRIEGFDRQIESNDQHRAKRHGDYQAGKAREGLAQPDDQGQGYHGNAKGRQIEAIARMPKSRNFFEKISRYRRQLQPHEILELAGSNDDADPDGKAIDHRFRNEGNQPPRRGNSPPEPV